MFDLRPLAIVLIATTALAQDADEKSKVDADALASLTQASETWDRVDSFVATVHVFGTGTFKKAMPEVEGRIWFLRTDDGWYARSFGDVTHFDTEAESKVTGNYDLASTPAGSEWVDHEAREVRTGKAITHRANIVLRNLDQWLLDGNDLRAQLDAQEIASTKPYSVGDTKCSGVLITEAGEKERWYFGDDDHLPRRIEIVTVVGSMVYEFTEVDTTRSLTTDSFAVEMPDGYTRVQPTKPDGNNDPRITRLDPAALNNPAKLTDKDLAPIFALKDPGGGTVSLEDLRGSVVVLDFWGTWCIPCRKASPHVQKIHEDYADRGVKVFGLAVRERSKDKPIAYFEEHGYTYGLLLDADATAREYKIRAYPTFIVIDQSGQIVLSKAGFDEETTFQSIRDKIDKLLDVTGDGQADKEQG